MKKLILIISFLFGFAAYQSIIGCEVKEKFIAEVGRNKALSDAVAEDKGIFDAWVVLEGDDILTKDIDNLKNISDYLKHNQGKTEELAAEFKNASDKSKFVDEFIGGPLKKSELEDMNGLLTLRSRKAWNNETLNSDEISKLNQLENKLGNYEYPKIEVPNFKTKLDEITIQPDQIDNKQIGEKFFWSDIKVDFNKGQITGLKPDYYNFVITKEGDLRIGMGHYHLSGEADVVNAAGGIIINEKGKITNIDEFSGHYKPKQEDLNKVRELFKEIGLTEGI